MRVWKTYAQTVSTKMDAKPGDSVVADGRRTTLIGKFFKSIT